MGKKVFILSLFLALISSAQALDALRYPDTASEIMQRVQNTAFPELRKVAVQLGSFSEADAYFQSNFKFWTLLSSSPVYVVEMNPEIIVRGCPPEAIEAILAHELAHTLDYVQGGIPAIVQIGWTYLNPETRAVYEHRTDLQAIFRGYGPGLIQYRQWIYTQLNPEQLALKKAIYYLPEEILQIQKRLQGLRPEQRLALEKTWLDSPPMNPQAIEQPL